MHNFDLSKIRTRKLLKWLNKARACGGGYDPTDNHGPAISTEELKEELAKREHIPNKQEARQIRQELFKYKRER